MSYEGRKCVEDLALSCRFPACRKSHFWSSDIVSAFLWQFARFLNKNTNFLARFVRFCCRPACKGSIARKNLIMCVHHLTVMIALYVLLSTLAWDTNSNISLISNPLTCNLNLGICPTLILCQPL